MADVEDRSQSEGPKGPDGTPGACSGRIVVISAPSGAGKTSITRRMLEKHPKWAFAVSATTRARREREKHGEDYYFLDEDDFRRRVAAGEMVEWEEIYGNLYGTMRLEVERLLEDEGVERILFDIDVKGALSLRKAFPSEAVLIFIAPPSMEELERRLSSRKTESEGAIRRRLERASMEMEQRMEFDHVIVNEEIDTAVDEIESILDLRPDQ